MKRKAFIIALVFVIILIAVISAVVVASINNKKAKLPYKDLEASDIVSVYILFGEKEPYKLTDEEKQEFVSLLRKIVVYEKDNSYTESIGGSHEQFRIEYANGKTSIIAPLNSFFVIDKTGYRTEYDPSEELTEFRSDLIQEVYFADN
ncbi:MAG: hypothetical protein ACI3XO_09070 [Eubacteriales bacterium]